MFETDNGMVIELTPPVGGAMDGVVRRVGSSPLASVLKVGDDFIFGMYQVEGNLYRGYVRQQNGFLDWSDITLSGENLVLSNTAPGHTTWRPSSWTPPSNPGNPGEPGNPAGASTLLTQTGLEGELRSRKTFKVTIPSGFTTLTAELSEEPFGRQLADMFLRRGAAPTASHDPYVWTADCAAVQPNRETERCVVNNPPAGDYYIMVYGYHAYWGAKLTVTVTK
jgi:hypothetical protein